MPRCEAFKIQEKLVPTYLGKCCAKLTVSTSTARVCPAKYSATSRRAINIKTSTSRLHGSNIKLQKHELASLGSVVVYGVPPLAIRICSRVSLKSLPATELPAVDAEADAAGAGAGAASTARPSRRAFSSAARRARSCLSCSICALTAARALASATFSVEIRYHNALARRCTVGQFTYQAASLPLLWRSALLAYPP